MSSKTVCPNCKSDQLLASKKGFNWLVGLLGLLLSGIGVFLGFVNANKIEVHCLNCGFSFEPGQGARA